MIQREELEQILNFVASRWVELAKDPDSKNLENLPNDFWMNSVGGKTAHWYCQSFRLKKKRFYQTTFQILMVMCLQ